MKCAFITSYERDIESGLDFAQARYYSSSQGRFTTTDPVGPNPNNPQTLNQYRYALNNPLRYFDKDGEYEEDVHRDLTRVLAYAAGFSMKEATAIGDQTWAVDTDPKRTPMDFSPSGIYKRAMWHFTTEGRRDDMWDSFVSSANRIEHRSFFGGYMTESSSMRSSAIYELGTYLHAQQDSFSHEGFGPVTGHGIKGHAPDKTYNDVSKANRMAKDTFDRLIVAAAKFPSGISSPMAYKLIEKSIDRFNRAKTLEQKKSILESMELLIRINRNLSDQRPEIIETSGTISTNITFRTK